MPSRKVVAAPHPTSVPPALGPLELYLLATPVRVYDTRPEFAPNGTDPGTGAGDTRMVGGELRTIDMVHVLGGEVLTGVLSSSMGVLLNVVVVNTLGQGGWLRFWAGGSAEPETSSINWDHVAAITANSVISRHFEGYVNLRCGGATGCSTDVVIDVIGYYDDTAAA